MPTENPIQFALVREDDAVELAVLDALVPQARHALLVASGGCTALSLGVLRPALTLTLIDANAAQLDLVQRKYEALATLPAASAQRRQAFGVAADDDTSLSGCGNFESLFRGLRSLLNDLVMPEAARREVLLGRVPTTALTSSRYWPVAFSLFFSDALLEAMFGPDATQHAPRGSYPAYFQRAIERGLERSDAATNPWLHQVLLGHWLDDAQPTWLTAAAAPTVPQLLHTTMQQAPSFADFDLVQLSNLFDWMASDVVDSIVARLCAECRPGSVVLLRQLNNQRPVEQAFAAAFDLVEPLSSTLTQRDRSLFYERILVFRRRGPSTTTEGDA
jgi:S-adenosylmethionine-diacylglycerol 3-amino-3-carboxypropyl transferase